MKGLSVAEMQRRTRDAGLGSGAEMIDIGLRGRCERSVDEDEAECNDERKVRVKEGEGIMAL